MENEIWKPVKDYEGIYEVSSLGRVRSLDRILPNYTSKGISGTKIIKGRVLKSHKSTTSNYYYVHLRGNGASKEVSVHRLVAKAFVPNPNNLPQVNHIDENPANNRFGNLEWCTAKYNINYGTRSKRVSETRISRASKGRAVTQYSKDWQFIKTYRSISIASRAVGVRDSGIIRCCKGVINIAGGYHWRYVE